MGEWEGRAVLLPCLMLLPSFWLGTAFLEISIFQLMGHWALD